MHQKNFRNICTSDQRRTSYRCTIAAIITVSLSCTPVFVAVGGFNRNGYMLVVLVALVSVGLMASSVSGFGRGFKEAFTFKPIEKYVEEKGYPIETHKIVTKDGYELTYHRVPHGRPRGTEDHGYPVMLVHGILQSSALYLAMDDGLAYLLADEGFDVWLANARGNMYSRKHKKYNPRWSEQFWNFSFHEMGTDDLPAAIDYILKETKRPSLSYIGFSMGTTMFFTLADSWGHTYMDRVDMMVAIAPMARASGMEILQQPKKYIATTTGLKTLTLLHVYELKPFRQSVGLLMRGTCSKGEAGRFCPKLLSGLMGLYPDTIHYEDTFVSTQYMPAGTSVKTAQHFLQMGKKAKFQQFDYGKDGNHKRYKLPSPPEYDLSKVTCPIFFISSDKDEYSAKEDVEWLAENLPAKPQILFHDVVKDFKHLDFFYSKNVKSILHRPLVDFISKRTENLKK